MKLTLKRMMAMLLVVAMVLGMMPAVLGATGNFTDVHDDAWYAEFVKEATEEGFMNGVGNNKFDPEGTTTRAMAVTVLYRLAGQPPVGGPSTFTDLHADWYANPVAWAQKNGVVNGVTVTTFCPDQNVTREQLVTMIWRYYGEPAPEGTLADFADANIVNEYAREAFAWAIGAGIINGMPKGETMILAPLDNATRAQFAKIIITARGCKHVWGAPTVTKPATCGAEGEATYTCTECGESKTEAIAPTGAHTWDEGKITTAPTCKDEGVKTFTCSVCAGTKTESVAKTDDHNYVDGKCSVCGKPEPQNPFVLSDSLKEGDKVVIVAAAKNMALSATYNGFYNSAAAVTPVDGQLDNPAADLVWTVGVEGDYYTFSYGDQKIGMADSYSSMPLGEKYNTWQVLPAKTEGAFYLFNVGRQVYMEYYETNGNWSGYYNNAAEELFALNFYVQGDPVPPCVHVWDAGKITTAATCAKEGVKTYTCTVCGDTKTESIPATGKHVDANKDNKCDTCGKDMAVPTDLVAIYNVAHSAVMTTETSVYTSSSGSVKDQIVAATATLADGKLTSDAANVALFKIETNDAGITTFVTADGKYMEADGTNIRFVDAPNENTEFVLEEVDGGYYIRLANYVYVDGKTGAEKPQYIEYYTSKNVFTVYGMGTDTTMYVFAFYPLDGGECEHDWIESEVVEPTCTVDGKTVYTCSKCGATDEETIPATGKHVDANKDNKCDTCGKDMAVPTDLVAIYNVAHGAVMTTETSVYTSSSGSVKDQIVAATATLADGKLTSDAANVALFKMETNDAGITTFVTADGKYMEADGTNIRFVDAPNENTEFVLEEVDGGYYIRLANYVYVDGKTGAEKPQYIEYYTSKNVFTVYGMGTDTTMYVFAFYPLDGGECEHDWIESEVVEPTCIADGKTVYTCSKCGATDEETIPATGEHVDANKDNKCDTCGKDMGNVGEKFVLTDTLKDGDQVVIVAAAKNMALSATYNGFYNTAAAVAPVDGVLANPAEDIIWTVGVEGDTYTFSYNGQKIGMGDSYSSMPLGEKHNTWQILPALTEGAYYVFNVGRQVYLEYYEKNSNWSGYYNNSDEALFAMNFYVKGATPPVPPTEEEIVILYTNDIHTYINNEGLKYSNVAALKAELEAEGKTVILVDAGDHVQGTAYGAMDKGETIIKLMNAAGYDLATLGNHEFDYGMARALELVGKADFPYVSANFYNEKNGVKGETVLDAYEMFELEGKKVALIGITTPETFTKSTPAYFMDENGNYIYGIAGGNDGSDLYADVQAAINAAKAEGADYVIALGHLGDDPASDPWNSEDVIAHVSGLDAFIDGHSHSTVVGKQVTDKSGKKVVLTQTGQYLDAIGMMTIKGKNIETALITEYANADEEVKAIETAWAAKVDELLGEVIAKSEVDFRISDDAGNRLIRKQETNLGDFCADALYYLFDVTENLGVDIAIMNGGGIRANMPAGDISYNSAKTVHTFGNVACLIEVSGQQILDALEWGAKNVGVGENGGLLHVSGVTYEIHSYIPSTVQQDDKAVWIGGPTGEYRVKNVKIGGEDLDLTKTYKMAGYNYTLRDLGDGFAMFGGAVNVKDYVMEDYMVLSNYIKSFPNGTIKAKNSVLGADYSDINGEGRIVIVSEGTVCDHSWDNGVDTKEATCEATGTKTYTCTDCGATKEETIPATGHNIVDNVCTVCGKEFGNGGNNDGLADGKYVIVAYVDGKYYAMSNEYKEAGSKINGVEISTIVDGTISAADAAGYVVTLGTNAEGRTIQGATGYLSYVSGTNINASADPYTWTITEGATEGTWSVIAAATATASTVRGLLFQAGSYYRFGGYANSNVGKADYSQIMFIPVV